MGLFNLWGKRTKEVPSHEESRANAEESLDIYSGMRVEVTTDAGQILFVAKLLGLHGKKAELHQYSGGTVASP